MSRTAPFDPLEPLLEGAPKPDFDRWALFLDVDGTLLEIAATPDDVVVPDGLVDVLRTLSGQLNGALALVSGRAISTLDQLFQPLLLPASGQHGSELRRDPLLPATLLADLAAVTVITERLADLAEFLPGTFIEAKGLSTAIHYRLAPEAEGPIRQALPDIVLGFEDRVEIKPSKMAFDLKTRGLSKGTAIASLMDSAPFAGRVPVMLGDDVTDEDGFRATALLGGTGILVGPQRASEAAWRLEGPKACRTWLAELTRQAVPA